MNYDAPRHPASPLSWLAAAGRLIAGLDGRYWALLILVYSGRAMLPFSGDWMGGDTGRVVAAAAAFLTIFWMPYLFIRVMAEEPRPGLPTLSFLLFTAAAFLLQLVRGAAAAGAHFLILDGGAGMMPVPLLFLLCELAGGGIIAALLALYAGTATGRLSPLEAPWRRALARHWLPLFGAYALVLIAAAALETMLPGVPVLREPDLTAILTSHLRQSVSAAAFLLTLGLALAACNSAARLPDEAPPR